jgi:hypothetical protein
MMGIHRRIRAMSEPATVLLAVLVISLVLPLHRGTRVWALTLVLPMWWLADRVINLALYGTGVIR